MTVLQVLDYFIPAGLGRTPDERRKLEILIGLLFFGALAAGLGVLIRLASEGWNAPTWAVMSVLVSEGLIWLLLHWRRDRRLCADLIVLLALAHLYVLVSLDDGLYSRAMAWFVIVPVLANLLGGRLRGVHALGLEALILGALYLQQAPPRVSDGPLPRAEVILLAALLAVLLAEIYEQSRVRYERQRVRLQTRQSLWLSAVRQELRTPLGTLRSTLDKFNELPPAALDESARELVRQALRSHERLTRLASDLVDLDRLQGSTLSLRHESADLTALVRECLENFRTEADRKQLCFGLALEPVVAFELDPDRIVQALNHLLSNAVKASPPDGEIQVTLRLRPSEAELIVADEGPGLASHTFFLLREPFQPGETMPDEWRESAGFGLYLCRTIAELHGGRLTAENRPEGGARLTLVLPRQTIAL